MAAAEPLTWRRRFPHRALRRLAWYVVGGGAVVAVSWLLFGTEPDRLASGDANPLARAPLAAAGLVLLAGIPLLLPVLRRPVLVADHYALTIRPGAVRTRLLPWAEVRAIAGVTVRGEPLLLVRADPQHGDRPRWCDQAVLRAAGRSAAGYQLALRLDEFAGDPSGLLAELAAWAPEQIPVSDAFR